VPVEIRPVEERDRGWLREAIAEAWGSDRMVSRGRLTEPVSACPGFVAELDGRPAGLALLAEREDGLEVVSLLALEPGAAKSSERPSAAARGAGSSRRTTTSTRSASTSGAAGNGSRSTGTRSPRRGA
jgi:hypothetical protein